MSRGRPQDVVVVRKKNTRSCVSIHNTSTYAQVARQDFRPYFRRFSTAFRQEIHSLLHRDSAGFQRLFRTFCTRIGHGKRGQFFNGFCGAFPKALADSAEAKTGGKKARSDLLRKTGSRGFAVAKWRGFPPRAQLLWHVEQRIRNRPLIPRRRTSPRLRPVVAQARPRDRRAARTLRCRTRAALPRTHFSPAS